jgi:hypothetical protein
MASPYSSPKNKNPPSLAAYFPAIARLGLYSQSAEPTPPTPRTPLTPLTGPNSLFVTTLRSIPLSFQRAGANDQTPSHIESAR